MQFSQRATRHVCKRFASSKANTGFLQATHPDEPVPEEVATVLARRAKVALTTYSQPPLILTRGKGCKIWDSQDREYLDISAGIAVTALGHADEQVARVLYEQSQRLVHCSNLYHNEWSGELAQLIVDATKSHGGIGSAEGSPSKEGLRVFFSNSGTEANEGALKFARKYGKTSPEKYEIVSFHNGFHGRSFGSLSATMQPKYQTPYAPLVPGFKAGILNDVDAIPQLVTEKTCGVIIEPIQAEGGIAEASESFLRALRKRCDEVGAVLIFDEIQCGLGRTGKLWAHSAFPVDCHPDVVTSAKALANGIPIGAIITREKVADAIKIGDHGTTFGGQPLQSRIAIHVLQRILEPSFLKHVSDTGAHLTKRLSAIGDFFPDIVTGAPRGRGLIVGLPLKEADQPGKLAKLCRERGLLILTAGNNTVRFVPALTITKEEIDKACDIVESALTILQQEK